VNPNERQATLNGLIWGAPWAFPSVTVLREMPFLRSTALFLADVHSVHCAQNALQRIKNGYFATARISVNRP
jgi:hypothetical protein